MPAAGYTFQVKSRPYIFLLGVILAILVGWMTSNMGIYVPLILIVLPLSVSFILTIFSQPKVGIISLIVHGFILVLLSRYIPGIPYVYATEILLLLTWIGILVQPGRKLDWSLIKNELCLLALAWFAVNVLELLNPAGASIQGWISEVRTSALYWLMTVPLCFLVFNKRKDLNLFLYIIIAFSFLAALFGMKQLHIGLDDVDRRFLYEEGAEVTHMLFGQLRVYSFYSDAGQFGASQAHIGLICLILALGPYIWWKRALLLLAGVVLIYGMLISGTRGALFTLLVGIFVALFLSKKVKILIIGSIIALVGIGVLKYTYIGNSNYQVYRLRTAFDPTDPSLNIRLYNQQRLRDYMSSYPFGGGVGVMGYSGNKYNADKFLAHVPPDSYWVKIWGMYGIVGFIIWVSFMMYILGKCCGIVWNIKDPYLKQKLIALTAGAAGIFFCSYGNEVMNMMPSLIILLISWAFIFMGNKLEQESSNIESHA